MKMNKLIYEEVMKEKYLIGKGSWVAIILCITMIFLSSTVVNTETVKEGEYNIIGTGYHYSGVIKSDGSLWMWGLNHKGQLGDGSKENRTRPVKIMEDVVSISIGDYTCSAIKSDGSLWMWGYNEFYQLGDGTNIDKTTPIKVMDNVKSFSIGASHCAAIKSDGSLWMWGGNVYGQLGENIVGDLHEGMSGRMQTVPMKVMDDVASVSLGLHLTGIIKSDKSLWMWGDNRNGQIRPLLTTKQYETPVKIMDDVVTIAMGGMASLAVKSDGSLWEWGVIRNEEGGYETKEPNKKMDNVVSISSSLFLSSAIKSDGSLWVWGSIEEWYIKDVDFSRYTNPVEILDNVVSVSTGYNHVAAIKSDGSLWMWGDNNNGQLGDGTNIYKTVPFKLFDLVMLPITEQESVKDIVSGDTENLLEEASEAVEICETIGMVVGSGEGLTPEYLGQIPKRYQGAKLIVGLRGDLEEAEDYTYFQNFTDYESLSWEAGRNILGYLKDNPSIGYNGSPDGSFSPNDDMTVKEYYKLMLVALGYTENEDFSWSGSENMPDVMVLANTLDLELLNENDAFTMEKLCVATVEALKTRRKNSEDTLATWLVKQGAIDGNLAEELGLTVK